jgi:pyroglutamyl-peptidase
MNQDALFRAFRSGYGADFRAAVRGAGVPTQVIAADTDAFCELDDMRAMAEAIPGARFDVIEACGHMATIEQLEVFNRVLVGFLQDEVPGMRIGLVTGSAPFAGCRTTRPPTCSGAIDGAVIGGVTIRTAQIPVSRARLPEVIAGLIEEHRPDFYVSLGLATGAPVLRFETTAINRVDFGVADNEGDAAHRRWTDRRRRSGCALRHVGRAWAGRALVEADIPAVVSHHAGTHLCNFVLYTALGAMARAGLTGPVGFLHLPYTPKQVARFLRDGPPEGDLAPLTPRALPSMPLEMQEAALRLTLAGLAGATRQDVP